jgi:hypothetical protein
MSRLHQDFCVSMLVGLVDRIKISLLLKIQWKQHHILDVKIVYNII